MGYVLRCVDPLKKAVLRYPSNSLDGQEGQEGQEGWKVPEEALTWLPAGEFMKTDGNGRRRTRTDCSPEGR